MNKQTKEFIAELRKFIKENEEEMFYYLTDSPYDVIQTNILFDFLLAKEEGYKYEDI